MAYFVVKHLAADGAVLSKPVDAITREEAISKSGVQPRNITSVEVDHFGAFKAALTEKRLPMTEQVLALVTISSKLEVGRTPAKAIVESIDLAKLDLTEADLSSCTKPGDFLKVLRFDDTAILLAEAGDKAGNLSDSLKRAATVLRDRIKTEKEFAKPMRDAALNLFVGIVAGIGFPLFGGSMLRDFVYEQKFPMTLSTMSYVLLWLENLYLNYWPLLIATFVAVFIFKKRIWLKVCRWPVFNVIDDRARCKRGLEFIQTYKLLTASGFTNPQVLKFLIERSDGVKRQMYESAYDIVKEGNELSSAFQGDSWPNIIYQNMKGFEQQTIDGRSKVLNNLAEALTEMFSFNSEKIARFSSLFAKIILIGSLFIFAFGFYAPLMTARMIT